MKRPKRLEHEPDCPIFPCNCNVYLHDKAFDDWEAWLPSEEELSNLIFRTALESDLMEMTSNQQSMLTKAIHNRLTKDNNNDS